MEQLGWLGEAISWVVGLVMGYGLKIGIDKRKQITQNRNIVMGKQAGRDIVEK